MRIRKRWVGKVLVYERRTPFRWVILYEEDLSDKPSGFPVPPPLRFRMGERTVELPWSREDRVP